MSHDFLCPFACHPSFHPPLFLCLQHFRSQMSGYVCVRSIWSTSRLFVEEFLQTSSSRWRGNLNCSAERACCFVPGIWALLFVISSSLNFPTWMPSGQTIWAGRCSRHWKESSSQTLWKGQQGRRGSGCLSVWIRMTMRRAGSCCSEAWHIMGQTGEHKVCPEKCQFHLGPSAMMDKDVFIVHWVLVTLGRRACWKSLD